MYTRVTFKWVVVGVAIILVLAACNSPAQSTTAVPTSTQASVPPTQTLPSTQTPPPMTAQPAPETPIVTEVLTITQETQPLQGDIPGVLTKPLENPSEWTTVQDLMANFPLFAWLCQANLTTASKTTEEAKVVAEAMNDQLEFDAAVRYLEGRGYIVQISKPFIFTDEFGDLPFDQTVDCKVQNALNLFGEVPDDLPEEIGVISVERTGMVANQAARERIWIIVWNSSG